MFDPFTLELIKKCPAMQLLMLVWSGSACATAPKTSISAISLAHRRGADPFVVSVYERSSLADRLEDRMSPCVTIGDRQADDRASCTALTLTGLGLWDVAALFKLGADALFRFAQDPVASRLKLVELRDDLDERCSANRSRLI